MISGHDSAERECELARHLVVSWREQRGKPVLLHLQQVYWQGSPESWQAFAGQMAISCPEVCLPEEPLPWQGMDSLDSIIDQLQDAPDEARILCAGCQCLPPRPEGEIPTGEAALLWVLGRRGGVRLGRGECYVAGIGDLADVSARVLQQSELETPPETCVSFFHAQVPDLSVVGWNSRQWLTDAHFGDLAGLKPMLVQTLAATYVQHHQTPCAWMCSDPHYALGLGVILPDDPSLPARRPREDPWREPDPDAPWRSR